VTAARELTAQSNPAMPAARGRTSAARGLQAVHVGCSGWNYQSWRDQIYPKGLPATRWLDRYAQRFDTVEVNTTFYRLIAQGAVERWLAQTPDRFAFAVKASRYLTHIKRLSGMHPGIERFYERIAPLQAAGRLACVLWQLPESFRRDDERLADALAQLPSGRHAFEFRHRSWFTSEVYELLSHHGAALVIGDHPERPFQTMHATAGWRYIRFHYGSRGRGGNYSQRELAGWAQRLHRWRLQGEVYAYFNNDWNAYAPRNALWLSRRLAQLAGEAA
jgi:uncharacterized protein YecE (DUF72 family)